MARAVEPRGGADAGPQWYTLKEVAEALGLTRQAVHTRVRKGQLRGEQQEDGSWRVAADALAAAIEAKRREAVSLGSVRVLPVGPPLGEMSALAERIDALEAVVAQLREEQGRIQAQRDQEVAALEERSARLQTALHQMVDLLGSTGRSPAAPRD